MSDPIYYVQLSDQCANAQVGDVLNAGECGCPTTDARVATLAFSAACLGILQSDENLYVVLAERIVSIHAASAADADLHVKLLGKLGDTADENLFNRAMMELMLTLAS
ncbi:MAG: hypothetical protein ACRDAX_00365 [Propionibacteriaceae bacterium]